ncbi:MAG TPA: GntR family transcriptional regulator [Pseudolabrys sp.]|nr:GntR family transcriptional regulator [Pseudolabrys sp.]
MSSWDQGLNDGTAALRRSTPELIADALRRAILTGAIGGGVQLKQNDVAARFGVSVVPVREAFQRLVAEGLALLQPNRGVTVTAISDADFREIAELRSLLEPHVFRLSAPRLTSADLARSRDILEQAATTGDLYRRAELHWEFHRSLYERAERPRILAQLAGLYTCINRYLLPVWSKVGLSAGWVDSHITIIDAVRGGEIEVATKLIVDQIGEAAERVRDQLQLQKA